MDFGISQDQRLLNDALCRYLHDHCTLDCVREVVGGNDRRGADLRSGLDDLGLALMILPQQYGGLGLGLLDAALAQEALGQYAAPVPFAASAVLAVVAIRGDGDAVQQSRWLPAIASGQMRVAMAVNELSGVRDGAGLAHVDGQLSGTALFVLELDDASHLLAADRHGGMYMVDLHSSGIESRRLPIIDGTRPVHEVVLNAVTVVPLGAGNSIGGTARRVLGAARVLLAADTLGAASTMLARAVAYAGERQQFGRSIASFQAVKHLCAEMAARLEPCRSLVWYAAYASDVGADDAELMSLLSKSHLAEVGQFVARSATEVHGGMGFTDLLGLHYWFKRIGANRQLLGGPERLRHAAAALQGWT